MIARVDPYTACWTLGLLAAWFLIVLSWAVAVELHRHNKNLVAGSSLPPTGGPAADGAVSPTAPSASSPAARADAAGRSPVQAAPTVPGQSVGAPTVLPVGAPKNATGTADV